MRRAASRSQAHLGVAKRVVFPHCNVAHSRVDAAPCVDKLERSLGMLGELPEWIGAAVVGAALATIGFLGKQALDWLRGVADRRRSASASLLRLRSLLRASSVTFKIQKEHALKLKMLIEQNHPDEAMPEGGLEQTFSQFFTRFTPVERELHGIIRAYTEHSLRPINQAMADWLAADVVFKSRAWRRGRSGELARALSRLETHLTLWHAKFTTWIPNSPEHALVCLADEKGHGIGFPSEIDSLVEEATLGRRRLSRPFIYGF